MLLLVGILNFSLNFYRSGADFLGPLLSAVAEICSDFDPATSIDPSLLKLFRNLWFYIVLFGLAPPGQQNQFSIKGMPNLMSNVGSAAAGPLQAVTGPYTSIGQWFGAVQRIAQGTPPLVGLHAMLADQLYCTFDVLLWEDYAITFLCFTVKYVGLG